jgi:cystathionine gamma-synthase
LKSKPPVSKLSTISIKAGESSGLEGSPVHPIWQTATYTFKNIQEIEDFISGKSSKIKYGRYGNPIQKVCEEKLAALEGTEGALLFPSGMSAITMTILSLLKPGDHVIYSDSIYRNSTRFFSEILPNFGVLTSCVPPNDLKAFRRSLKHNTKLVFFEIPTNLFLRVPDIPSISALCKRAKSKPLLAVDSTFATPCCFHPLDYGADLVIHSLTKYIGGHDDLLAGCVCGSHSLLDKICAFRDVLGSICDPHNTFLCMRSIKTFPVRMDQLNRNGQQVAEFLANCKEVEKIFYPGLDSHPDHKTAKKLLKGFGSVIYFNIHGGAIATNRFIESLKLPFIGTNFGGVHTFIEPFSLLTLGKLTKKQRATIGVGEDLIRLCVGLEDSTDIIDDFHHAFMKLKMS